MPYKILAINLGATSTKIAYYEDDNCVKKTNLPVSAAEAAKYKDVMEQYSMRLDSVRQYMEQEGILPNELDAVVSRGGHTRPIPSGTYLINETMLREIRSGDYGRHPCDVGSLIATTLCEGMKALPLVVDPPVTDEFDDLARLSGLKAIPRVSRFHALNQKAMGREAAERLGRAYEDLNLIIAHMGGGISVCAHKKGRMVDANNGLEGEGPYSTNRAGALCAAHVVKLCFTKGYDKDKVLRMITGEGGLTDYLGTTDLIEIEQRIEAGDAEAKLYYDGLCYQTAKEIGAMAAVLEGSVDGIVLTGGMANSKRLTEEIRKRVGFIGPVYIFPGENEMKALALGALRGLRGECRIEDLS